MKISEIIHRHKILPVQSRKISQQKTFGVPSDIIELSSTTRIRDMKKDIDGAFKVKFDKLLGALNQYQVYELSTGDYSGQLETILKKAKHINEVLAVLKKYAFFSDEKMRDIADEFVEDIDKFNAFHKMRIKRDFTGGFHLHSIFDSEIQTLLRSRKIYSFDLGVFIFQCEVNMTGTVNCDAADFSDDPDRQKGVFQQIFERCIQVRDGPHRNICLRHFISLRPITGSGVP